MRKQRIERWIDAHTFTSERLVYRPPRRADAAALVGIYQDDEVRRWQGWGDTVVYRQAVAERSFARPNVAFCPPLLLVCTPDGAVVGDYSVERSPCPGEIRLGWSFGTSGRGRGYGSESLPAVLHFYHRHVGAATIRMGTSVDNHRALRQIAAAGAVLDPTAEREHPLPDGSVIEARWFVHEDPDLAGHLAAGGPWVAPCLA